MTRRDEIMQMAKAVYAEAYPFAGQHERLVRNYDISRICSWLGRFWELPAKSTTGDLAKAWLAYDATHDDWVFLG